MKKIQTIFIDLDNVLALFSIKGQEADALKNMWKRGYFKNLPLIEADAPQVVAQLNQRYKVYILSKAVKTSYCRTEKLEWLEQYLPFLRPDQVIIINTDESKADYIQAVAEPGTAVLIDDYKGNLEEFKRLGGLPIKKRFSNKGGYTHILHNWDEIFSILENIEQRETLENQYSKKI